MHLAFLLFHFRLILFRCLMFCFFNSFSFFFFSCGWSISFDIQHGMGRVIIVLLSLERVRKREWVRERVRERVRKKERVRESKRQWERVSLERVTSNKGKNDHRSHINIGLDIPLSCSKWNKICFEEVSWPRLRSLIGDMNKKVQGSSKKVGLKVLITKVIRQLENFVFEVLQG